MGAQVHVGRRRMGTWNLLLGAVALAIVAGCEAIVGSAVPTFKCSDSDPSSCPVGQVCATATGQCIAATASCNVTPCAEGLVCDQGTLKCVPPGEEDASTADGNVPGKEGGVSDAQTLDVAPGTDGGPQKPYPNGISCSANADCQSGLCADSAALGDFYYGKTGSVCSVPCCTSESCGAGLICVGSGTGGHYCVPTAKVGITVGNLAGGATCSRPLDCRSGQCIMGVCADACCTDTNCTNGAHCRVMDLPAGHISYACGTGGTKAIGTSCTGDADCVSGSCYGSAATSCRPACCGQASSISQNYGACTYVTTGTDVLSAGLYPGMNAPGTGVVGTACTFTSDCKSNFCVPDPAAPANNICTDVCCTDDDCKTYGNYKCRPSAISGQHPLICVKVN